jgi:hypothetical protein
MKRDIETIIATVRKDGGVLNAYEAAKTVQGKHNSANVAIEDIIEFIIQNAGSVAAIEFDPLTTREPLMFEARLALN